MKRLFAATAAFMSLMVGSISQAETLSVSSITGEPGYSVTLSVMLTENTGVAGAAFTVSYNTSALTLSSVESDYFPTFAVQGITDPDYVTVDTETYYKALVVNGDMLAAARVDNGVGDQEIFRLHFDINSGAAPAAYNVEIAPSIIDNAAAGYMTPTAIPLLVGIDGTTYPERATNTNLGIITVVSLLDSDSDGISDSWEKANVPPDTLPEDVLHVFTATGDHDNDGYSDLQEYKNRNEDDPAGAPYIPTEFNAPYGTGYQSGGSAAAIPIINFLLLKN